MDWPGLDRWGTSEDDATDKLGTSLPRYAAVAERASLSEDHHVMDHAWEMEDRDLTA